MDGSFPMCRRCGTSLLVPLSDYSAAGVGLPYKAWACTNPSCGFNIKIRNGRLVLDEPMTGSARGTPRSDPVHREQPPHTGAMPTTGPAPVYRVGDVYDAFQTLYPTDESKFSYCHGRFELALCLTSPRSAEVRDVRAAVARFALFIEHAIVVLLSSFGDSIDWMPDQFVLRSCGKSDPSLPPAPSTDGADILVVLLVDAGSRVVRVVREVPLTTDITQALRQGVHEQAALLQEPGAYNRVMEQMEERYPTEADLVEHAVVHWSDGDEAARKPWRG
jgi:hypothetical protein